MIEPQKIPTREGFDYYRQTMVLGNLRYGLNLRYNPTCDLWMYAIDIDGSIVLGYEALVEGQIVANTSACLPWSFGGLFLERVNTNFTGIDALPRGSLCLWFFHTAWLHAQTGSTDV